MQNSTQNFYVTRQLARFLPRRISISFYQMVQHHVSKYFHCHPRVDTSNLHQINSSFRYVASLTQYSGTYVCLRKTFFCFTTSNLRQCLWFSTHHKQTVLGSFLETRSYLCFCYYYHRGKR